MERKVKKTFRKDKGSLPLVPLVVLPECYFTAVQVFPRTPDRVQKYLNFVQYFIHLKVHTSQFANN